MKADQLEIRNAINFWDISNLSFIKMDFEIDIVNSYFEFSS